MQCMLVTNQCSDVYHWRDFRITRSMGTLMLLTHKSHDYNYAVHRAGICCCARWESLLVIVSQWVMEKETFQVW